VGKVLGLESVQAPQRLSLAKTRREQKGLSPPPPRASPKMKDRLDMTLISIEAGSIKCG